MSKAPEEFERACSYAWYVQEYGTEEEQRLGAANVSAEKQAWTRVLLFPEARRPSEVILCNPEDSVPCKKHDGT